MARALGVEMDTLQDIRLLLQVVRTGSLSAAGREAGLSAVSVWRRLNALEDRLGVPLLLRHSRGVHLTDAGAIFLQRAEGILREFDELAEAVASFQAEPRGLLHIQATVAIGTHRIAPAMPRFLMRHPGLRVNLWITQDLPDLTNHDIDVSIRVGRQPDSMLVTRRLAAVRRLVVASPNYLGGRPPVTRPIDLLKHDCLVYRYSSAATNWSFDGPDGRQDVAVIGRLQANTVEPLRLGALEGLGVALLPEWWISDDVAAGRLQQLLEGWTASSSDFDFNIYAVWRKRRHMTPKMRAIINFLVELFREAGEDPAEP